MCGASHFQRRGWAWWGLVQCSEHLCNNVVACVIISPWRSPSLCKQAELMSPRGAKDKERRPHDSLTVGLSHPLTSSVHHIQSSCMLSSWPYLMTETTLNVCKWEKISMRWTIWWTHDFKSFHNKHGIQQMMQPWSIMIFYAAASSRYHGAHVSRGCRSTAIIDYRPTRKHFPL